MRAYSANERVSILVGKCDVRDDHRWPYPIEGGKRVTRRAKRRYCGAGVLQCLDEQLPTVCVILEEHDGVPRQADVPARAGAAFSDADRRIDGLQRHDEG